MMREGASQGSHNRQSAIENRQCSIRRFELETKRQYEVVFIVDPTVDDEVAKLTDNFKQIVTRPGWFGDKG